MSHLVDVYVVPLEQATYNRSGKRIVSRPPPSLRETRMKIQELMNDDWNLVFDYSIQWPKVEFAVCQERS